MSSSRIAAFLLLAGMPVVCGEPFRQKLPDDKKIVHALNRLTWGPRAEDVDRVPRVGLKKWVDEQLHPNRIHQSVELEARLRKLETLRMSPREMSQNYPPPGYIVAVAKGTMPPPVDPERREIVMQLVSRYKKRSGGAVADVVVGPDMEGAGARLKDLLDAEQLRTLRTGTVPEKLRVLQGMGPDQVLTVLESMPRPMMGPLFAGASPELRRKLLRYAKPHEVVAMDLTEAKLLRAVYSERQLEDVLTDFWFNHFNVFLDKGADRYLLTSYERDAIRPHVLGKFRELLRATAGHPAMLFYLDNWQSVDPKGAHGKRGLNENYARELLELHTMGVDGGYTQKDVNEVARCFTGWTIFQPFRAAEFRFEPKMHDRGEKTVLGVRIPAGGGQEDGLKVLDILAAQPSTAHFISLELAQRFVADAPPEPLVRRMADTFRKKDGDLREVMKTMLSSPEFWSEGAWRAKVKSPLEMAVSALRASGAEVDSMFVLGQRIAQLGQPLYRKLEPTGYRNLSEDWVNSAGLLGRMNLALALAENKLPGVRTRETSQADVDAVAERLLFGAPSAQARAAIDAGLKEKPENRPAMVTGLVLGSPDFQRR